MIKRKNLGYTVATLATVLGAGMYSSSAWAGEAPTSCDGIENCAVVSSAEELDDFFTAGSGRFVTREGTSTMIIGGDFTMGRDYYITDVDLSIYLSNHTVVADDYSFLFYDSTVNIYGDGGVIDNTGNYYAPLYLRGGAVATMYGGVIRGGSDGGGEAAVIMDDGAKFTLDDGEIYGETWVISVFNDSEFVMNGGSLTTTGPDSIGVSGNGTSDPSKANYGGNAKFILNAGTITSNDVGVYAPQVGGETVLGEDLVINAAKCGVEIRAGSLTVDGATISVPADAEYVFNPNGSGSTASGVAIAIAQHTTKQPIDVTVNDGNFTAPVAFAESNPQHNPDEDVEKVALLIAGGTFNATNGDPIVSSEDVTRFVTGGAYNKDLDARYIAAGYVSAMDYDDNAYKVVDPDHMEDPNSEVDTYIDEETGEEKSYIAPVVIDYGGGSIESDPKEEGEVSATVEFAKELIADRKAKLSAVEVDGSELTLDEEKGGDLIGAVEIDLLNRDNAKIEVTDNEMTVFIDIDEDIYTMLSVYNKLYAVYFENGVEVERYDVKLSDPEEGYYIYFKTTHLSTYGVVGTNEKESEEEESTSGDASGETAAPETGTVTVRGASAINASVVTAAIIGVLASVASFAYLRQRKW